MTQRSVQCIVAVGSPKVACGWCQLQQYPSLFQYLEPELCNIYQYTRTSSRVERFCRYIFLRFNFVQVQQLVMWLTSPEGGMLLCRPKFPAKHCEMKTHIEPWSLSKCGPDVGTGLDRLTCLGFFCEQAVVSLGYCIVDLCYLAGSTKPLWQACGGSSRRIQGEVGEGEKIKDSAYLCTPLHS